MSYEMNLAEYVGQLPELHLARRQWLEMTVELDRLRTVEAAAIAHREMVETCAPNPVELCEGCGADFYYAGEPAPRRCNSCGGG